MLAPTTRKYSLFWDSSNTIFKTWLGLISVKNSEVSLPDSSGTTGVPVLSGLWRHFERRRYPSVGRACCVACTGWCCGHTHTNISTRDLSLCIISDILHLMSGREYNCLHPCNMSTPAVLSHIPSLPKSNHVSGSISPPAKIFYSWSLRLRRKISTFSRSPKSLKCSTWQNWLRTDNSILWCCKSGSLMALSGMYLEGIVQSFTEVHWKVHSEGDLL